MLWEKVHLLLLVCGEYIVLVLFFLIKPVHVDTIQNHGKDKYSKEKPPGKSIPGSTQRENHNK